MSGKQLITVAIYDHTPESEKYRRYEMGDVRVTGPEDEMRELAFDRDPITSVRILREGKVVIAKVFKREDKNHILDILIKAGIE